MLSAELRSAPQLQGTRHRLPESGGGSKELYANREYVTRQVGLVASSLSGRVIVVLSGNVTTSAAVAPSAVT